MLLDQEDVILIHKGTNCLVALGSNQEWAGKASQDQAISELSENGLIISKVSRLFRTPCFPKDAGPDFVNAALMLNTVIAPDRLMVI